MTSNEMSNSVGLNLVPRSRAAKAAWKAACGNMAEESIAIPLGIGDNIIGRAYFPGSDCLWLGIPSCAEGIREWHVRLRTESRNQETVAIHAYAPVRIREISGEVKMEFTQGGQGCLAVGQTLELDVDELGRASRCLYYYALEVACSASFPTTPVTAAATKSGRSSAARRSGLASVRASCGNSNDIRRFLERGVTDIFAKFEYRGEPYQGAGGKVKTQPLCQGALRSDDDDDDDDVVEVLEQPMSREASHSKVFPRRRKRGRDHCLGVNPFVPSELVDLCDTDNSTDAGNSPSKAILVESDDEDADRAPRSVVELDDEDGGHGSSAFITPSDVTNHPGGSMVSLVVAARRDISSDSTSSAISTGFCSADPVSDSARRVESVTIKEGEMDGGHDVSSLSSPRESRVVLDVKHSSRSPFGMDRLAAKSSMAPLGNHRPEQDRSETSSPPCINTTLFVDPVTDLKIIGRTSPVIAFPVMERLLVCGSRPPGGLSDMLVSELLKSTCETRTECLRRQLHYMLNASFQPWHPERNLRGVPGRWLEGVMLVITRNSALRNRTNRAAIAKLDAHVAVLELIVTFVGRSPDVPAESGQPSAAVLAGAEKDTVGASRVDKLRELFPWEKDSENQKVQKNNASRAVAKCAGWAVELWRSTISVKSLKSLKSGRRRGQGSRGLTSMVHTRARLLTGRLLAEVVDSCGLSLQESCAVVLDELKSYRSYTSNRDGYATRGDTWESEEDNDYVGGGYSSGVLDAAALGGFIRSLCGFPLCAVLARQLLLDNWLADDVEGKLKRLLTRSSRHPGRGGMLLLPL